MNRNRIIIAKDHNPAYNLGLEEYLIDQKDNILYLWQNDNTIVIGRNQNPYKECNIGKIEEDNVHLVRRRSGGGAVFHDMGNLNFTIINKKTENNIEENFEMVNRALASLGINSVFNGRNDLTVDDKKISGNAFFDDGEIFCHHGTMLIDVDMTKLSNYLTASKLKLKSKGIDSVKSRVVNLKDIKSEIEVSDIIDVLIEEFKKTYNVSDIEYFSISDMEKDPEIMEKVNRYLSWDWVYGESPESNMEFEEKFNWGIIDTNLMIINGKITNIKIFTDSIINDNFDELANELKGEKLKRSLICDKINEIMDNDEIKRDLCGLVNRI